MELVRTYSTDCPADLLDAINALGISFPCIQIIDDGSGDLIFEFSGDLIGDDIAKFDSLLSTWDCAQVEERPEEGVKIFSDEESYTALETREITLLDPLSNVIVQVYDPLYQELIDSTLLSGGKTAWDPTNRSTNEANINNGVYTDLAYNNSASGSTAGFILGVDMGVATTINTMKMWDYTVSYYNTSWEFIGTNDSSAATYDVIFSETQSAPYLDPDPFFRAFSDATYRYYGMRCVTSFNASYCVWREMELFVGTLATVERKMEVGTDYAFDKISDTRVDVTNSKDQARTLKTVIVGK